MCDKDCEGYPGIAHDFETMRQVNRELVEALEAIIDSIDGNRLTVGDINQGRAALAKAKGEQ